MKKMRKILTTLLLCMTASFCALGVACGEETPSTGGGSSIQQPNSSDGGSGNTGKPQKPTDHVHTAGKEEETSPSCTEKGYRRVWCKECEELIEEEELPATGHRLGEGSVQFVWTGENAVVEVQCANESCSETFVQEANVEKTENAATCEAGGSVVLRATATVTVGEETFDLQDERVETGVPLGHCFDEESATLVWDGDNATAHLTCTREECGAQKQYGAAVEKTSISATCETGGVTVWTASYVCFAADGKDILFTLQDEKREETDPLGHDYAAENCYWEWAQDYTGASYILICKNDSSHTNAITATVTAGESAAPTCQEEGYAEYTASVLLEGETYTDLKRVTLGTVGHEYIDEWTWADDYSSAHWRRVCKHGCGEVWAEKDATVSVNRIAPTCEAAGSCTYTAQAYYMYQYYRDSKTEAEGEPLGHSYAVDENNWLWNEDGTVEAYVYCTNAPCENHFELPAELAEEREEATCLTEGSLRRTASVVYDGESYTTEKTETLEVIPHEYAEATEWEYEGDLDGMRYVRAFLPCRFADDGHGQWVDGNGSISGNYADCTQDGHLVYDLSVEAGGVTYTKHIEENTPARGHFYGRLEEHEWKKDGDGVYFVEAIAVGTCQWCYETAYFTDNELSVYASRKPTCTQNGYITYEAKFERPNDSEWTTYEELVLAATGHTSKTVAAQEPTCTENGWYEYEECGVCGYDLTSFIEKQAKGHRAVGFACGECNESFVSEGLAFTQNADGSYSVTGMGTCTDTRVLFPSTYEGQPVTGLDLTIQNAESVSIPKSVTTVRISCADSIEIYTEDLAAFMAIEFDDYYDIVKNSKALYEGREAVTALDFTGFDKMPFALTNCTWLEKVTLPSTLTDLSGLGGCSGLKEIVYDLPNLADYNHYNSPFNGVTYDGLSVVFGDSVETVPAYLFYQASGIESVVFGRGVKSVGSYAFDVTSAIQSVAVGDLSVWQNIVFANAKANPVVSSGTLSVNGSPVREADYTGYTKVNAYAFYGLESLEKVILPETVTVLEGYAFYGCKALSEVDFRARLTTDYNTSSSTVANLPPFGGGAGETAESFRFTVGEGVTNIPAYLLYGNEYLDFVSIPSTVATIGKNAFSNCYGLSEIYYNAENATIGNDSASEFAFALAGMNGESLVLTIGKDVVKVPAFVGRSQTDNQYYSYLSTIVFEAESKVEELGYYAFYGARIESIELPSTLTKLGAYSLAECDNLTELVVPDSVNTVENSAVNGCEKLESLTIGAGVVTVGDYAFAALGGLETLRFNAVNCGDFYEFNHVFSHSGNLLSEDVTLIVGSGVKEIPAYAFRYWNTPTSSFQGAYITRLVFEENSELETIGKYAFSDCMNLENFTLPEGLVTIDDCAFAGCRSLTEVTLPDSLTTLGGVVFNTEKLAKITVGTGLTACGASALNSVYLQELHIKDIAGWCGVSQVRQIGNLHYATVFENHARLYLNGELVRELVIPEGVTKIEYGAFTYYDDLESVTLPSTLEDPGSFYGCKRLIEVYNKSAIELHTATYESQFGYLSALAYEGRRIYVPASLAGTWLEEDENGFRMHGNGGVYTLVSYVGGETEIVIPDGISSIGQYAFEPYQLATSHITKITVPKSVTEFRKDAFMNCDITEVYYEGTLEDWMNITFKTAQSNPLNMGAKLFIDGELVTEIAVPKFVTKANPFIFYNYPYLQTLTTHGNMTKIDKFAFYGCSALSSVTLEEGLLEIANSAFENCGALEEIVIPEGVTYIAAQAFRYGEALRKVTLPSTIGNIGSYAFYACNALEEVHYNGTVQKWAGETHFLSKEANPLHLGAKLYISGKLVTEAYLTQVQQVQNYVFVGYAYLEKVTFGKELFAIGTYAFSGTSLTEVTIGTERLDFTVYGYAFANCTQLKTVAFIGGLYEVYAYAFSNSGVETLVTLSRGDCFLTNATANCPSLTTLYYRDTKENWELSNFHSGNEALQNATVYFYTETEPALNADGTAYDGNYWKFAMDSVTPEKWIYTA